MYILIVNVVPIICSFFTYRIIQSFLVIQEHKGKKLALLGSCFLLDGMIIYIGDWANMPPTFLIFVGALFWCCEGSSKKKLTLGLTLCSAPFALNCLIDSFVEAAYLEQVSLFGQSMKIVFWVLLWLIFCKMQFPNDFDLPSKYWNVLLLVACTPFLILLTLILVPYSGENFSPSVNRMIICILVVVILSITGVLYAIYALYKAAMLEESKLLLEANDQYYRHLDSQMGQIRKFRHDMTNHLQVLYNLPEAEMRAYVEQLLVDKAVSQPLVYCRDSVFNAILSAKTDILEQERIMLDYDISLVEDIPLTPTDKCALFGNLLDNAIEGCSKVSGERRINLKVSCAKGLFIIKIQNNCIEELLETLQTTKKDKSNHGFGLKSVRDVVERHHGSMTITNNQSYFEVFIVINKDGV